MNKPDKAELSNVIRDLEKASQGLARLHEEKNKYDTSIYTSYDELAGEAAVSILDETDVDELNKDKSGIRTQLLKDNGIENLSQLADMDANDLSAINGIGAETAAKILEKSEELQQSAKKYAKVKLNADDKRKAMQTLLSDLAFVIAQKDVFDRSEALYKQHYKNISMNLPLAKKMKSTFGWLFASKGKKESQMDAFDRLSSIDSASLKEEVEALSKSYDQIKRGQMGRKYLTDFRDNAATFYAILESIVGSSADSAQTMGGLPEQIVRSVEAFPLDLSLMNSVLRNYQVFGTKYVLHQRKVLLGDEMGLGKTMQAIASIAHLKTQGKTHFLVVCPVSVMVNWTREIEKHSQMEAVMIHGHDRDEEYTDWLEKGGIAITTFETITRLDLSEWVTVDMLVVDEAHYVKNPKANRTVALKSIADMADYICFMSGTPLENKVEEMSFLISMLNADIAREVRNLNSLEVANAFRQKVAPVYLRRVREDVLTELPEKIETEQWIVLGEEEKKAYKQALKDGSYMKIRRVSWNTPDVNDCSKANRLLELCEQAREEGRRVIVFSFFLDVINLVQDLLGEKCYGPITGGVSAQKRQEMIDDFSTSDPGSVLLCQIIAAGTGLNIQSASMVIICEPQWKPSTETQAISRAYRMGQTQTVMVHRLLADDTVDERIMEVLKNKTELFEGFADESAANEASKEMAEELAAANTDTLQNAEAGENQTTQLDQRQDISAAKQSAYMKEIIKSERERYGVDTELPTEDNELSQEEIQIQNA